MHAEPIASARGADRARPSGPPTPPRSYSYDSGGAGAQAPPPGATDRHYEAQQRNLREDLGGVIFRERPRACLRAHR